MSHVIAMILDGEYTIDPRVTKEAQILKDAGFQVHVLCYAYDKKRALYEIISDVHVHRFLVSKKWTDAIFGLNNSLPFFNWLWSRQIKRLIAHINPTSIHANDLYMIPPARKAIGRKPIYLIADLHENFPATILTFTWAIRFPQILMVRPKMWERKEKRLLKSCHRIIVLSEEFLDCLSIKHEIDPDKFFVFPNVPEYVNEDDCKGTDVNLKKNPDDFVFLYIGAVAFRRGIQYVLEAMKLIMNKTDRIRFVVIGPVDKLDRNWFLKEIASPQISGNIEYIPWKEPSALPNYIMAADACISPLIKNPQHESGIANKVFQSLLYGKPVIASDCLPQAKLLVNNSCGVVYRYDDVNELANAMMEMTASPELLQEYGINGRRIISEKYNSAYYGRNLIQLYSTLD